MVVFSFLGGIALFLLGMKLLTDGLKLSAGDSLRNLLARWTSSATKGVLSGIMITGLVQSSSAVIFATIGFVNAGIMSLTQAVYVIYGSNVGTTFTGWIISSVGLQVDLQLAAMPALAIGMALWLGSGSTKRGALGQALVGLAIFFLGIDILKDAFDGLGSEIPFEAMGESWGSRLLMLLIGIILTTLMQSSSATIAIVITAVAGGFIPVQAGATMVIGADIGTTSTAIFAVIGATSAAKRSAAAHVLFNVVSGIIVFLFTGLFLSVIYAVFGQGLQVAFVIALFHTMKKLTGLALFLPFTPMLVKRLETMFTGAERKEEKPRYLDDTVLDTPAIAISALIFELKRIGRKSRSYVRHHLKGDCTEKELHTRLETIDNLQLATVAFIQKMHRTRMPSNLEYALPQALRVLQYFREAADHVTTAGHSKQANHLSDTLKVEIERLEKALIKLIKACDSEVQDFDIKKVQHLEAEFEKVYDEVKITILSAGSREELSIQHMFDLHEMIRNYRRVAEQLSKAAIHMDDFNQLIEHAPKGTLPED